MSFYRDHVYPHLVRTLGDPKFIQTIRQRIVPLAQGKVLEIGVGPGVNFVHYDPGKESKLFPPQHWVKLQALDACRSVPDLFS
jgi:hypothetical protein